MAAVVRTVLSVLAGLTLSGGLVIAVEVFGAIVHPTPPGFTGTKEEMCEHVARYPQWVLAIVVVAWSGTALASTWVAARLGGRVPGLVVALLLLWAAVTNVSMLPYPMWFKVAVLACISIVCVLGIRLPSRPRIEPRVGAAAPAE